MITHFLGDQEVTAYARDFAARLVALGPQFPKKCFLLGQSGEKMAAVVFAQLEDAFQKKVEVSTVYIHRKTNQVRFKRSIKDTKFGRSPVLLIDSAVHSGQSMAQVVAALWKAGAQNVLTYTLMLKRSSKLIPTYFGILVEDNDRVYFQLDEMPNNRLCERPPFGILKEVELSDANKILPKIGSPFDHITIGDLYYDKLTRNYHPYIYEYSGEIAGIVSFGKEKDSLFIDALATTRKYRGKGIGGALLRWAETWGRANRCSSVKLWAFKEAVRPYRYLDYEFIGRQKITLSPYQYWLMGKRLLHGGQLRPFED